MLKLHFLGKFKVKIFASEKLSYVYDQKKILKNTQYK